MLGSIMEEKAAMARALAAAVREALARADTDHIAFHGCIDWHSAVHGTWALTAYTRMTGDTQYAPFIAEILTPGEDRRGARVHCCHAPISKCRTGGRGSCASPWSTSLRSAAMR